MLPVYEQSLFHTARMYQLQCRRVYWIRWMGRPGKRQPNSTGISSLVRFVEGGPATVVALEDLNELYRELDTAKKELDGAKEAMQDAKDAP